MAEELLRSKHVFGSLANLEAAIADGRVDSFDILFLHNENNKPIFGWLDRNCNPVFVEDETRECVIEVEALPEVGEVGKIYLFEEDGYFWDGEKFVNLCKPTDVTELEASIKALEDLVKKHTEDAKAYTDEKAEESKAYTDQKSEEVLDQVKHSYEAIKYEFTDVPVGTIIDYRENEIRIMCPYNAVFTKQAVGVGGDANCYYGTLKTYVPNDAVVGYIEHLGSQVDTEILNTFSTDAYGRKYQSTWLALAKYDEATGWTYYGKSSSKEKYIGWDYQIDWYDADGIMIASDSIRINLSNEECHSSIEPYYVSNITKNVEEKIEMVESDSKAYTDEQITMVLDMFTIVEI